MPTYEYACRACGHIFEIVQKMSDDPLVICPECGGELRKVFAPPAISFKGSGFYATDQRQKSKASERPESKGSESKGGESKRGGESKGDTSKGDSKGESTSGGDSSSGKKAEGSTS